MLISFMLLVRRGRLGMEFPDPKSKADRSSQQVLFNPHLKLALEICWRMLGIRLDQQ